MDEMPAGKALSLNCMKIRACIVLIIWCILLVEPVSAHFTITTKYSSCDKKREPELSCSQSGCDKPAGKEENNECRNNRCNPLMSCPTGNFYLFGQSNFSLAAIIALKQK